MFIVIDWIDSSWKETQVNLLVKKLEKSWKKVKVLDYPRYDKASSFAIKKYLSWKYWKNIWAKKASIFYAIDRFDSLFDKKMDFKKYDYIISNRYVSSSMIHQWWKIDNEIEKQEFIYWLENLEYNIFSIPKPDKTIFLHISLENSLKLLETRWKNKDIHEQDINHLKNAYNTALYLANKKNWIKIDCEYHGKLKSIENINSEILKHI
jgi:dTMP kinase